MFRGLTAIVLIFALTACTEREVLLEGERLDARGNPVPTETVNRDVPLALPGAVSNTDWTHPGGNASHQIANVALSTSPRLVWSANLGQGNSRKYRITADPVLAGNRIFAMDSRAQVSAFSTAGAQLWSADLTPAEDRPDEASGGGIAVTGGRVFVNTGFGELNVLDAASGGLVWRQDFDATLSGAPMVRDGTVFVVTTDATGWALEAETGRILWQSLGAVTDRASASGPSPVSAGPLVVFPFASGQMVAAEAATGRQAWAASVAGERLGRAFGVVNDLTGAPIYTGGTVYAASQAGRAAAFDATTGAPRWRAETGALGPLWLAGSGLFFVNDKNQLTRLDAATGETVWAVDLPFYRNTRIRRRQSIFAHHGPMMAGGRLWLISDDGLIRHYNPASGALIGTIPLPDGAARNPVVAGGTLYIVTEKGDLLALR